MICARPHLSAWPSSVPGELARGAFHPFSPLLWFSPYRRCDLGCQDQLLERILYMDAASGIGFPILIVRQGESW